MTRNIQELVHQKIAILCPNAKYTVRPYDKDAEHLLANPIKVGDFLIDWHKDNADKCPEIEAINAIDDAKVNEYEENCRKKARNADCCKSLALVALFEAEKKTNANLEFGDYLDSIELIAKEMSKEYIE